LAVAAKFDSREIRTEAEPGAAVVELCYEFTNTGDFPLAVESFSQSCGCMRGSWNGVPVEPGARGSITARLLTRGLRGKVRKSPHVGFFESGDVELIGEVRTDSKDPRDALHGLFALVEKTGREGGRP
jgi:hypothetical protein